MNWFAWVAVVIAVSVVAAAVRDYAIEVYYDILADGWDEGYGDAVEAVETGSVHEPVNPFKLGSYEDAS